MSSPSFSAAGLTVVAGLSVVMLLGVSCGDPRTGGIAAEIRDFEDELDQRTWDACGGGDRDDPDSVLEPRPGMISCQGRLGWSFNSCERATLAEYPEAARAHMRARLSAHGSVVECCQAGGPGMPRRKLSEYPACDAPTVDACIAHLNRTTVIGERVVSPGVQNYYAEDNAITSEVIACLDHDGYTHQAAMLPRVCGKSYICPRQRAVTVCYDDGTCDEDFEEITRDSPWYDGGRPAPRSDSDAATKDAGPISKKDAGVLVSKDAGTPPTTREDAGEPPSDDTTCAALAVVASGCGRCHGATPNFGASVALDSAGGFQEQAKSQKSKRVWQVAFERVNSATNPMPPKSEPPLSPTDKATLSDWLASGAPAPLTACP